MSAGDDIGLIQDPREHAKVLAEMISKAAEGFEVGTVRAHREQWAVVIAALLAYGAGGKLERPAQVGNTIFHPGIERRLVVERACREYEYQRSPEIEVERLKRFREFLSAVEGGSR